MTWSELKPPCRKLYLRCIDTKLSSCFISWEDPLNRTEFEYRKIPIGQQKARIKDLGKRRNQGEFDSLVIVGEDSEGFEKTFDFSSMVTTTKIRADVDEYSRYDADEVIELLLEELTKNDVREG